MNQIHKKKRVQQFTLTGDFVAEYPSISYAVAATGASNLKLVCKGKRNKAGGYIWKYA